MAQPRVETSWAPGWRAAFVWFALALALRLLFLGRFSLWGDEVYSLDDALSLGTPRLRPATLAFPLFFLLERGVLELAGFVGVDHPDPERLQWWLRLVPAIAGAAAAGGAFVASRDFLERRERHLLAALVTFSPWLLFFSQNARFYTPMLALATPASFGLLRAWRDADLRAGVRATGWLLLAVLTHPTALLLLVGHCAGVAAAAVLRARPLNRGLVGPLALPVLLALPALAFPDLVMRTLGHQWTAHDAAAEPPGELVMGIAYNVGPVVAALALLGLPLLWRRDRAWCIHLVAAIAFPLAALLAMAALGKSVEQRYLIALVPLALAPAAIAIASLWEGVAARGHGGPLVPVAALLSYAPGLVSNYLDGDRHDLASAVEYVASRFEPGDGIIAKTHMLLRRYLPADFPDEHLLEAPPPPQPDDVAQYQRMWRECPRIWVVVPAEFDDFNEETRSFQRWAWQEGRLQAQLWPPRLDYHQNRLRIFLVDPKQAPAWSGRR